MGFLIGKNLAQSTLASGYTAGNTSLTVQTGDGAKFDAPSGGNNIALAIGNPPQFFLEATAVSTDTFTVGSSGFDGSTAVSVAAGTPVTEVITGAVLSSLLSSSAGALTLLAEQTASNSATLDFTSRNASGQSGNLFQTDFDTYQIEFVGIIPVTSGVDLELVVSTNAGSSWDTTSSHYSWACFNFIAVATGGAHGSTADSKLVITDGQTQLSNSTSYNGFCATYKVHNPLNYYTHSGQAVFFDSAGGYCNVVQNGGFYYFATGVNAIRILASSGNLSSGSVRVYGIAK